MKTIRLWQLGYLDTQNPVNSIIPTKQALDLLKQKISEFNNIEEDVIDFIWGPELKLQIFSIPDNVNIEEFIVNDQGKLERV